MIRRRNISIVVFKIRKSDEQNGFVGYFTKLLHTVPHRHLIHTASTNRTCPSFRINEPLYVEKPCQIPTRDKICNDIKIFKICLGNDVHRQALSLKASS